MFDQTIQFARCEVRIDRANAYAETVFDDGATVAAVPHDTAAYRATAADLGYGDDLAAMSREHEAMHTLVAEAQGHPYSPTLWAVAHGLPAEDAHYAEERLVLDFQRFCNGGAVTDAVRRMPPGLRERALRLLRPAS